MKIYQMTAITMQGLEQVCADELSQLGAQHVSIKKRAVTFTASKQVMYMANLYCRTALRLLRLVEEVRVRDEEELYQRMYNIPWEELFDGRQTILLRSKMVKHRFNNTHFFTLKAKDAVVDRFRDKTGSRPSVDKDHPHIVIHLFLIKNKLRIFLDSSGASLHKRAYRRYAGPAALNEVLAAGIVTLAELQPEEKVINPMCGSGTLAIEATFLLRQMSPQGDRHFSFEYWNDFDSELWEDVQQEPKGQRKTPLDVRASDIESRAVKGTEQNVATAELEAFIQVKQEDFFDMEGTDGACIFLNPPYGERMQLDDLYDFYARIGDTLKQKWQGSRCAIISSDIEALNKLHLRPSKKFKLYNGPIPTELRIYEMYGGSRKIRKKDFESE